MDILYVQILRNYSFLDVMMISWLQFLSFRDEQKIFADNRMSRIFFKIIWKVGKSVEIYLKQDWP